MAETENAIYGRGYREGHAQGKHEGAQAQRDADLAALDEVPSSLESSDAAHGYITEQARGYVKAVDRLRSRPLVTEETAHHG